MSATARCDQSANALSCLYNLWFRRRHPNVSSYNAPKKLAAFLVAAHAQANKTRGRHIMWTMGADFTFANAEAHFRNIDRLIRTVNKDGRAARAWPWRRRRT